MVGVLAGLIAGGAVVVGAWNESLFEYSVWVVLGGALLGALIANVAPRTIGMAAVSLQLASIASAVVSLMRGHPAFAAAFVVCIFLLAGPQVAAREVMKWGSRSGGFDY